MEVKKISLVRVGGLFIIFLFSGLAQAMAIPLLDSINNHYYEAIPVAIDWNQAKTNAENSLFLDMRGHLATLTSAQENLWVWENLGQPYRYYLGATDVEQDGVWKWVTGEPWIYTNWKTGEPNNLWVSEEALTFWDDNTWNDLPMSADYWDDGVPYIHGYIVEYDLNAVPEPAAAVLFSHGIAAVIIFSRRFRKTKRPAGE